MHAVLVRVSIESGHEEEALEHLRTNVVPRVKQAPGIVGGYWLDPTDGRGAAMTLWESEEAALRAVDTAKNAPGPASIRFLEFEVREVIAQV